MRTRFAALFLLVLMAAIHPRALACENDLDPVFDFKILRSEEDQGKYKSRLAEYANAHDKVAVAARALAAEGVELEIIPASRKIASHIVISVHGNSRFNRLARNMREKYQTTLVFDPEKVVPYKNFFAFFDLRDWRIFLPHDEVLLASPGPSTAHEVKHAALEFKERQGRPGLDNGLILKSGWRRSWPWGPQSVDGYVHQLSFQERATWGQYMRLIINDTSRVVEENPGKDVALNVPGATQVFGMMSDYLKWARTAGLPKFKFLYANLNGTETVFAEIRTLFYTFRHQIPATFWKAGLPAQNLEEFLNTEDGKTYFRASLEHFLGRLHKRVHNDQRRAHALPGYAVLLKDSRSEKRIIDAFMDQLGDDMKKEGHGDDEIAVAARAAYRRFIEMR